MFDPQTLKYDANGLLPVIAQSACAHDVLLVALLAAAWRAGTLRGRTVPDWSPLRQGFWVRWATSGPRQTLVDLRYDCDQVCLLAIVMQEGPACHTNRRSCFYTSVIMGDPRELSQPIL